MARKRSGVNVSEAIRNYLKEHSNEGPTGAAKAISEQIGKKVSPTYVSNIKTLMKAKPAKRRGRKPGTKMRAAHAVTANGSVDLSTLEAIKEIVSRVGADNTRRLIDILA